MVVCLKFPQFIAATSISKQLIRCGSYENIWSDFAFAGALFLISSKTKHQQKQNHSYKPELASD